MQWNTPAHITSGTPALLRSANHAQGYARVLEGTSVLRGAAGAPPHRPQCASAAPHLDDAQKVDGRGVEVLRLDARDERRPGSGALDRRELHTSHFGHAGQFSLRSRIQQDPQKTRARSLLCCSQ